MNKTNPTLKLIKQTLIFLAIVVAFILSVQVTQPDLNKLVSAAPKAGQILRELLAPDLLDRGVEVVSVELIVPVPCGSATAGTAQTSGARITISPACANPGDIIQMTGVDLGSQVEVVLAWKLSDGMEMSIKRITTDANGAFTTDIEIRPIVSTKNGKPASLQANIQKPVTALRPSQALMDVVNAIFVTIFMSLLATTLGTIIAAPLSFLAASNITRRGCIGSGVYYVVRGFFNIIRSYEPLVMATVFALIVGFGSPFAGVLALVFVTTASLGKMFSESVEGIDAGPIEALTATGANRFQVVVYSVVPQVIPDFLSFIIYHWDINVRISTIIGFVGGGGIGYYLSQRINTFEYSKAGTAIFAIIIVVWVLDFLSSEIRKRLT